MSIDPAILRAMAEAGASIEVILAAVEAAKAKEDAILAEKRAKAAAKKARQRAAKRLSMSPDVPGTDGDTSGQTGTDGDSTPSEVPPQDKNSTPPPTSPSSDADASAPAVAVAGDDREWLFDDGLKQLIAWGKPEKASRSLIGKWLKTTRDDADLVRRAIEAAAERRVVVPVEWIEQGLRARMERNDEQRARNGRTHPAARPGGTAARVAAIMGYGSESDLHGPEEERRLSDRSAWPEGRDAPGLLDAKPGPTGLYRA